MSYELWDTDSGNCIGEWESEEAAIECVRSLRDSKHGLKDLFLGEEPDGRIWNGEDLLELIKEK